MFYTGQLNNDNVVIAVSITETEVELHSGLIRCNEDSLGKVYNEESNTFTDKQDTNTYLTITTPPNPVQANSNVNVAAVVKDAQGNLIDVTTTYYVPVIRTGDNSTAALLTVSFVNGEATTQFQISQPGIYTVKSELIYPLPSSIFANPVTLIVV